jgi:hypothetical protein
VKTFAPLPLAALLACAGAGSSHAPEVEPPARWAASKGLRITVFSPEGERTLTDGHHDWKPVWNLAGDQLAFFRTTADTGPFIFWKAALMVARADGGGVRQLTDGTHRDFNPTWTRDGSGRILFNRYGVDEEPDRCEVWSIAPDGAPGSEVRLSSPAHRYEWVDAGLRDGRLFVDTAVWSRFGSGSMRSFLLTPAPGGGPGRYQELRRPTSAMWHKLSVSPSETKVAYMLDVSGNLGDYSDDLLYWAELDAEGLAVKNPVRIRGSTGRRCVNEYPRWSADERLVLFDSSCGGVSRVYAYRLADGAVAAVPPSSAEPIMFPSVQGVPQ